MIEIASGLLQAAIVPALLAALLWLVIRQLSPGRQVPGWAIGPVFAAAYCAGHIVATWPNWVAVPARNWHWILYLAPLAAVVGAIGAARPVPSMMRWSLLLAVSVVAAWLLTHRPNLWLPRAASVALLSVYFFSLAALLEPLSERVAPAAFLAMLALAAAALAAMITSYVSITHGQLVAAAAAALAGAALVVGLTREANAVCGLPLAYATVLGGWAFVEVLFEIRLAGLLLVPAAPLALWACVIGPLSRPRGAAALCVQTAAVVLVIAVAGVLLRIFVGG